MTRDEILILAESVGCGSIPKSNGVFMPAHNIEKFASLIAAAEREECISWINAYSVVGDNSERMINAIRTKD